MFQTYFPEAEANIAKDDFAGDFLLLTYRKPTHDMDLAVSFIEAWNQAGQDKYDLESFPLPVGNVTVLEQDEALDEFMRSDHVALWRDNIPAIYISDSGNKNEPRCEKICFMHMQTTKTLVNLRICVGLSSCILLFTAWTSG